MCHFVLIQPRPLASLTIALLLLCGAAAHAPFAAEPTPIPQRLESIPPLEPEQAMETFELVDGYRIELVAAEPLVSDPIAFCFDGQGRLIVVEMRGYSERPDALAGRIRRLTDTDGDGRMDEAETLLENLSWPTAVACWRDGVVVAVAPDILYAPGDAAPRRWFTGFGRGNVQGLVNSLRWGLDNRLHGATSSSGAELTGPTLPEPLQLGRRDFAIAPLTETIHPVNGGGQHGLCFDPWGDKFVCSNSDHLQQVLLVGDNPQRASRLSDVPPFRRSIAADGPQADVYRTSPVEPWRILRTHLRVTGQATGPVEGGGRAAGYFTGATGIYVYDGDQWPMPGDWSQQDALALVCDVGSNLVHRKRLRPDGLWRTGHRIDQQTEFLRSSDIWFRPVQLGTGPDGALYIADMYREVIEHPKSLPPPIKSQLDLNSGNDRGRIWRVVATDRPHREKTDDLGAMASADLVSAIDSANAWHRRTAARLLLERQDATAIAPLRAAVRGGRHAEGRLQALASLSGLPGGVDAETLGHALADPHPRVRQHAIQIAAQPRTGGGPAADDPRRWETLAADTSLHVRFQLALESAALVPDTDRRAALLASIAAQDPADPWIRWAVEGSLGDAAAPFLIRLRSQDAALKPADRDAWLRAAVCQLLYTVADGQGVAALVELLEQSRSWPADEARALQSAVASQLQGLNPQGPAAPLAQWIRTRLLGDIVGRPAGSAPAADAPPYDAQALRLVRWSSPAEALQLLDRLLSPHQPPQVQTLALQNLVAGDAASVSHVMERLPQLTPALRSAAIEGLAGYRNGLAAIAQAVINGSLSPLELSEDLQRQLREYPDSETKKALLGRLQPAAAPPSSEKAAAYTAAIEQPGDVAAGRALFQRLCASCHRLGDLGTQVGPDLRSLVDKPPSQILMAVLDPNAEVDPRYRVVTVVTVDGRIVTGVLESESADSLRIVSGQGEPVVVPREDVDSLQTSNRSLMPDALAQEITPAQMRDLITFLRSGN